MKMYVSILYTQLYYSLLSCNYLQVKARAHLWAHTPKSAIKWCIVLKETVSWASYLLLYDCMYK